jgi:spermidine/putrescine transport system permease protein
LLFAPFALWIALLIILPHLGMFYISLREKVARGLRVRP